MSARRAARLAAVLAAAGLIAAGCGGGGGGGGGDAASSSPPPAAVTPAAGVTPTPTDQLFGVPEAVDTSRAAGTLDGYEEFGTPRDAFEQVVRDDDSGGGQSEAVTGAGAPPTSAPAPSTPATPVTTDPLVAVPGGGVPTTPVPGTPTTPPTAPPPTAPPADAPPVQGFEADFDIGGEPVVARVGDAIPPESQQFTVADITPTTVVLELNGGLLPDGSDRVTMKEGESISLVNQTSRTTYRLRLLDIRRT